MEERHCHLHHCVQVHQEKPEWKSFSLFISLIPSSPSISLPSCIISPSLPLFLSPLSPLSPLCPLSQQLTLYIQEQTEISIHVMPHSLATPTNRSMQLACTHSKRPFEYSSANSCIHWYLKCSGSARALNPRYIWLNLKKEQRRISGTRIKTVFIVQQHQIPSGKLRLLCVCLSSPLRKWKNVHCQCSLRHTDNNLKCT